MENYDRQQYNGGDFGEVRENAFADPFDGEAVSQDAGQGDYWGGYPDRDIPQEEQQQEQGFVEGDYDPGSDYDPGFIPEGEYTPGSEYDPGFVPQSGDDPGSGYEGGYDPEGGYGPEGDYGPEGSYDPEGGYEPLFTWGGFEDDVVAKEPLDAPTADSSGGTPPLETVGWADAAGDPEIQMYSDDAGQAGSDANYKQFVNGLYERYPKELAENGNLQILEQQIDIRYKVLSSMQSRTEEPSPEEQKLYEQIEATIRETEQERASFVQQKEAEIRQKAEEEWKQEKQVKEEEWKREMQEQQHDEIKDYPEDVQPFFKVMYGIEDSNKDAVEHVDKPVYEQPAATETFKAMFGYDPGEEGADHVHDSVVDPVGDL